MLVTADWVLPISTGPIKDGALFISNGRVADIGPAHRVIQRHPDAPRHDFPGHILMPGLVNAHTHLAMTCLKGLIPPQPFDSWITHIPRAWNALSQDDIAASIALGAIKAVASGTVAVGDIAYGSESMAIAADTGLGGVFFWEVLGIELEDLPQTLCDAEYPSDPGASCSGRLRCGISPHAPYTSGPRLIRGTHTIARAQGTAFGIHVAESPAEETLLMGQGGGLSGLAGRLARGFEPPRTSTVRYLDRLGALDGALAIHCTRVTAGDVRLLAAKAAGIALCPRSNAYLHGGVAPVKSLADSGVRIGIGTDSLASNTDLDLFEEARALRAIEPGLANERIIDMMTREGAQALAIDSHFGVLETGRMADFTLFRVAGADPHAALVENAGRSSIEAVMSGGIWRVLSGAPVMGVSRVERGAHLATERAGLAIAGSGTEY